MLLSSYVYITFGTNMAVYQNNDVLLHIYIIQENFQNMQLKIWDWALYKSDNQQVSSLYHPNQYIINWNQVILG